MKKDEINSPVIFLAITVCAMALTFIFAIINFADIVAWKWYWILSPLWITMAILIAVSILTLIIIKNKN